MNRFQRIALASFVCLEVLIFLGAIVRATGSGLGCPDWPRCYGCLVPPTDAADIDFSRLDLTKFKEKAARLGEDPASITIDTLRARFDPLETWIEYLNRVSSLPLLIALAFLLVAAFRQPLPSLRWSALGATVLFLMNAVIGALVVKSLLKPNTVSLHMFLAIVMLSVLVYTVWRGADKPWRFGVDEVSIRWLGVGLFVLVAIEGIMGSQVREMTDALARTHAGHARSEWVGELEHSWTYLVHRSFSWLILGCGIWFFVRMKQTLRRARALELSILALITAQMLLGVVLSQVGIIRVAQVLHIGLSSLLVSALFLWLLGASKPRVVP